MPVFFNDWRAQRGRQWNTRQRERRQFAVHTLIVGMPSEEDMPTTILSHDEYDVGILEGASLLPPEQPGCKLIKIIQLMNYAFYCLTNISVLDSC